MHTAKLIVLLLLTVGVMRAASWCVGWLLKRVARMQRLWIAALSNALGFSVFAVLLATQRMPGEPVDFSALWFGLVVFAVCAVTDMRWTRWGQTKSSDDGTA